MTSNIAVILIFLLILPLAIYLRKVKQVNFEAELTQAVEARGGTVLSISNKLFRNGPWWVRGKGRLILKVIYRDAEGQLCQLWGRTGTFFGNELNWEYNDGEYDE